MKFFLGITLFIIFCVVGCQYMESKRYPYEEGPHWDYSIQCENGFVYKTLSNRRGTIQVLNSDGTPLRCDKKIY